MANVKISDLTAASSVADANQFEINESGTSKRVTASQIKTYLTGSDLDMGGNKVLFANVYSALSDLPNASTYHGMFAHVHATGKGYFAHGGNWIELQNASDTVSASGGTFSGNIDVTGTVTSDGLTVDSDSTLLDFSRVGDAVAGQLKYVDADTAFHFGTTTNHDWYGISNDTKRFKIDNAGDISFYEDTGTTAKFFWDASAESVGIGTTAPDALAHIYSGASGVTNPHSYTKLHIESSSHAAIQLSGSTGGEQWIWFADDTSATPVGGITYYHGENYMAFRTNSGERARITDGGDLRVGKTSPALADVGHELDAEGYAYHTRDGNTPLYINRKTNDGAFVMFYKDQGDRGKIACSGDNFSFEALNSNGKAQIKTHDGNEGIELDPSGYITFEVGGTERVRIDGNVLVGANSFSFNGSNDCVQIMHSEGRINLENNTTSSQYVLAFYNPNGLVGKISTSGSSTSYSTSSDYRLKENVADITDGITRVKQLSPKRFNFIADADTIVDGFLAHEAQAVVPEAVTGEKDEVDGDNNPVMQGIDQAKLVPLLTAALQEAIAKIETLETKVAALEEA